MFSPSPYYDFNLSVERRVSMQNYVIADGCECEKLLVLARNSSLCDAIY